MGLARTLSRGQAGLDAYLVTVEVHLAGGLPGFAVTGLPAAAVRESKDRVRAALSTSGYPVPPSRITVHLGPADIPKTGGRFDLAIALGVLLAQQDAPWPVTGTEFLGELALNGDLRPINGALPAVLAAQQAGHAVVLPSANAAEAALVADAEVYVAGHLNEVVQHLSGGQRLPRVAPRPDPVAGVLGSRSRGRARPGIRQARARRRRGRRPQPADDWPARQRQEHARRTVGRPAAAARPRRHAARRQHRVGGRRPARRAADVHAAVSRAASHDLRASARRRRHAAAAGRDLARASRRVVLGRAARVWARRARGAARAARKRRGENLARARAAHVSGRIHPRRRDESVFLRVSRRRHRSLPVHAVQARAVPRANFGAAARSLRSARRGAARAVRGHRRAQRAARVRVAADGRGRRAPRAAHAGRAAQCAARYARAMARRHARTRRSERC